MSVLGKRLKQARDAKKMTQIDAAKKLGISNGTLSGYERNYRDPDTLTLEKMAALYEVKVDWLLGRDSNSNSIDTLYSDISDIDKEIMRVFRELAPEDQEYVVDLMKRIQRKP
ncbi:XRE family transcriptional regulator [Paenibacillus albiflavus]|uniref:XRE family transcriptional regulator n=1 Tax=Paenibacillus albiflavus TaxID=2545760 RepID=A0A4R4E9A5_9BACL|nr:helix-turn-helix transcriptional regulator [Paenibacillus albiflavus]TCZ76149.1 XRE family transcriptional regulator [Paenibacillus albiflavus]